MFYISEKHGCVYSIYRDEDGDGDYLIMTPLNNDNTFNPDTNVWIEVDELALLGEEQDVKDEVDLAWQTISSYNEYM